MPGAFLNPRAMPGMGVPFESSEYAFLWQNKDSPFFESAVIASTAVDAGNTPTTTLRGGLLMGIITASKEWAQYDPAATDGTQIARGILAEPWNMLGTGATVTDQQGLFVVGGWVKASQLIGLDLLSRRHLNNRFVFDDDLSGVVDFPKALTVKATSYTVTAADNQTLFTTRGAVGAVTFTLPTLARGLEFEFYNEADQNMLVTGAAANLLVCFNNLTATTVSYQTGSAKIGGSFRVTANDNATKWLVQPMLGSTTQTVTVA